MSQEPSPATLDAAVDAAIAFAKGLRYLGHPEVRDYLGTANGDSPEKWERDYITELCRVILAASAASETACKATSYAPNGGASQEQRWNCEECGDVTDTDRCPKGRQNETLAKLASVPSAIGQKPADPAPLGDLTLGAPYDR